MPMNIKKTKSKEQFYEKINTKSQSTIIATKRTINLFDNFLTSLPDAGTKSSTTLHEEVISELQSLKPNECIDTTCELLQDWINYLTKFGLASSSIRRYFSTFRPYLYYRGIKLDSQDVTANIVFPSIIKEERYPLTIDVIRKILNATTWKKKGLYLTLVSSGMRIGEAIMLRKRDFDMDLSRIRCRIPARITKTKIGRTTYVSREAAEFVMPLLQKLNDDDMVFGTNQNARHSTIAEVQTFGRFVDKVGLGLKYDTGRKKISLHSFRAFFFTRAARAHDENYAHMMTGHGGYLMQYDRLTDAEKLDMYIAMESELLIFDQNKNQEKIKSLQTENSRLVAQKDIELETQRKIIQKLEQRLSKIENQISN